MCSVYVSDLYRFRDSEIFVDNRKFFFCPVYISRIPVEDDQRKFKCHYQYNPYIENSVLGLISRLGHLKNGPAVSIQYVTVTDRQTDRHTIHTRRAVKKIGQIRAFRDFIF